MHKNHQDNCKNQQPQVINQRLYKDLSENKGCLLQIFYTYTFSAGVTSAAATMKNKRTGGMGNTQTGMKCTKA